MIHQTHPALTGGVSFINMKERPIIFSGPMVRAILDGRKTQTRRVAQPQPMKGGTIEELAPGIGVWQCQVEKIAARPGVDSRFVGKIGCEDIHCPYGRPGDRLWVRESWAPHADMPRAAIYRCDPGGDYQDNSDGFCWHPSIHMPRWASRITLEVVSVRVERLDEITPNDCRAEGQPIGNNDIGVRYGFGQQWEADNGPGSWEANPWVWVVEFRQCE